MRLLVTGTSGHVGSRLAPIQQRLGVTGLDTGFHLDGWLYSDPRELSTMPRTIVKDLQKVEPKDLAGMEAVVHLAELSNETLGENNPEVTYKINHEGSANIARMAKTEA